MSNEEKSPTRTCGGRTQAKVLQQKLAPTFEKKASVAEFMNRSGRAMAAAWPFLRKRQQQVLQGQLAMARGPGSVPRQMEASGRL